MIDYKRETLVSEIARWKHRGYEVVDHPTLLPGTVVYVVYNVHGNKREGAKVQLHVTVSVCGTVLRSTVSGLGWLVQLDESDELLGGRAFEWDKSIEKQGLFTCREQLIAKATQEQKALIAGLELHLQQTQAKLDRAKEYQGEDLFVWLHPSTFKPL